MMAVRAVNTCSILHFSKAPPFFLVRCRFKTLRFCQYSNLSSRRPIIRCESQFQFHGTNIRSFSVQSLVDSVMEELASLRKSRRKRVCPAIKLTGSGELLDDKLVNRPLEKGLLLEFKKDTDRILLAVARRPDGKKNWMVYDQNGVTSSIKPQQVTYIVPGVENFDHTEISNFVQKAQDNLDPSLLEFAWVELLETNKSVTPEELAEMIFGSAEPLESYCAHLLLSKDEMYFTVLETKGSRSLYGPRPTSQVEELMHRKLAKDAAEKELQEFVQLLKSAKAMPSHAKPSKSSWMIEEKTRHKIESLEAYAIDACKSDDQKRTAGMILKAMGMAKIASSALNLLIDVGYFPLHVNLDILKLNIRTDHSDEILSAAENLLLESVDPDKIHRKDLTHLKVYAIDVDEADELDDALSATKLQDGRIKIWIHVADPGRYVQPGSKIDREAMKRGTSVFLPTATYPMFPEKLAMDGMSLKQGEVCNAVSVSVVLHSDGWIDIWIGYRMGAVNTATLETRIKVANPEDPEPSINLYVENQADPAMRLVSEMMILCGEVVATYGSCNNIPLPYRGQPQSNIDVSAFAHLPEGPVRSAAVVKIMRAAEFDFRKPVRHGILGIPGYVKAVLRGEPPPFSAGQLEGMASMINMQARVVRSLCNSNLRYWIIEFLKRQPKERRYRALILRFIKDRIAALLLVEVGFQASAWVSTGVHIGDEIQVQVKEAHPRDDFVSLTEVVQG
ncbi:ribonuclease II, putative [Ricinus communis]|uniref:Ribonuclease II, putative n=1 Tax=Ricinus communis TaxID=3988 RepID=B9T6X7_RICCO|nr:ribonuclease II, putative [Ricinus communis]